MVKAKSKKLNQKKYPVRKQQIRGLSISSQHRTGKGPGGEFFDFISYGNYLVFFLTSTHSYRDSSEMIQEFISLKEHNHYSPERIQEFFKSINEKYSNKNISALLMIFDLRDYSLEGHNLGESAIYNRKKIIAPHNQDFLQDDNHKKNQFSYKLKRGSSIQVLSPGFIKELNNTDTKDPKDLISPKKKQGQTSTDLFFQLSEKVGKKRSKHDFSTIEFEVGQNALILV